MLTSPTSEIQRVATQRGRRTFADLGHRKGLWNRISEWPTDKYGLIARATDAARVIILVLSFGSAIVHLSR